MKSWLVHYSNKYPGGRVECLERDIIVYCAGGKKRVQLWKDGNNMWRDVSSDNLCVDRHDLAPIPKETRAFKLYRDGSVGPSEEYPERLKIAQAIAAAPVGGVGKVPSIEELEVEIKKQGLTSGQAVQVEDRRVASYIEAQFRVLNEEQALAAAPAAAPSV